MTQLDINLTNLQTLFREIGLYSPGNKVYKSQIRKHEQIFAYIAQIKSAFSKLSTKRPIVLLDCGCGKSYLSFVLYQYCQEVLGRELNIIGVDNNAELISKCSNSAKNLGFAGMQFYNSDIAAFKTGTKIDIIYSLHACDAATDQTIAKGINMGAKYIFSVSCCQHTNRGKMAGHCLTSISRYRPYKERLVDMIGDSMRALLLENLGYGVSIFEFATTGQTPKNIMLRAIKGAVKQQDQAQAMAKYKQLVKAFNFAPALENMLRTQL